MSEFSSRVVAHGARFDSAAVGSRSSSTLRARAEVETSVMPIEQLRVASDTARRACSGPSHDEQRLFDTITTPAPVTQPTQVYHSGIGEADSAAAHADASWSINR